jgi:hypothetical protein
MPTHARRRDEAAVGEAGKIVLLCSRQILPAVRAQFKTPSTSVLITLW